MLVFYQFIVCLPVICSTNVKPFTDPMWKDWTHTVDCCPPNMPMDCTRYFFFVNCNFNSIKINWHFFKKWFQIDEQLPQPKNVSDEFFDQTRPEPSDIRDEVATFEGLLDTERNVALVQWSQFIEHDLVKTVVQTMSTWMPQLSDSRLWWF